MQNNLTISLLITYYNEKELLTQCLLSVYQQIVLPNEIIVYDDASLYPASQYIPIMEGIEVKVIRGEKNIMLAAARNELMKAASSEYIHYQDADDLLEPNCIAKIIETLQNNTSLDLVVNEVRSISFENNQPITQNVMGLINIKGTKSDFINYAISGSLLAPSVTFRKELGIKLGGYNNKELKQCEDMEFNTRLLYNATHYEIITLPLIIQRIRIGSMSHNKSELWTEALKAFDLLIKELPIQYHEVIAQRVASVGHILYCLGHKPKAREAWKFAKSISNKLFTNRNPLFQFLYPIIGIENMEYISLQYQKLKQKTSN